jgi:uncharacterized protein (TIGR02246 family)
MVSELTAKLFAAVDATDARTFSEFFTDDGRMVFGNADPMVGRAEIQTGVAGFFGTINGVHHTVINEWVVGADTINELSVIYERHDGKTVTIPAATVRHVGADNKIDHYCVYVDLTPVYA